MKRFLLFLTLFITTCLYSLGATVGDKYDLVTSTNDITSGGEYILVYVPASGNNYVMGGPSSANGNFYFYCVENGVTISNNTATISSADVQPFTLERNGDSYGFKVGSSYLNFTNSNASMQFSSNTGADFTITFLTKNEAKISTSVSSTDYSLEFNVSTNPKRVGNYKNTLPNGFLYKKQTSTPPTPTKPSYITFKPEAGSISTTDQISLESDGTTINYSIDNQNYDKTYSTPFTLSAGEHTVYAKASNDAGDFTASAKYTVTATTDPVDPPTDEKEVFTIVKSIDQLVEGGVYTLASGNVALGDYNKSKKCFDEVGGALTISGDDATVEQPINTFTIEKSDGNYYFVFSNEYLGLSSSTANNNLQLYDKKDSAKQLSISINKDNTASITFVVPSGDNKLLQYSSANSRFSNYKSTSGMKNCEIYVKKVTTGGGSKELGEVTYTVTGDKRIDDDAITVDFGDVFTFSAENADNIAVTVIEGESDATPANGKFENGVYTWTIDKYYDTALVEVTASLGDNTENLSFFVTVTHPALPAKPVLKNGDVVLSLEGVEEVIVASGTELTIDCEGAVSISGYIGEDNYIDDAKVPYPFKVTKDTYVYVSGVNAAGAHSEEQLEITVKIGETDANMPALGSNYRQMLNVETLDKGFEFQEGYYIIGRYYAQNNSNSALSTNFSGGQFDPSTNLTATPDVPTTLTVDTENGDVTKEKTFTVQTVTGDDVMIFYLEKNDQGQMALRTVNYGDRLTAHQKYLAATADPSSTSLALVDEFTPVNISLSSSNNADISFGDSNRRVRVASNGKYQYSGASAVQLYRYTESKLFVPDFAEIVLIEGTHASEPITPRNEEYPSDLSYRVKGNTTIISISDDNVVTAQERVGKATIVATWGKTADWFAGRTEIPVTIKKQLNSDEFFFRHELVRGKKDVGIVSQAVYYAGTGTVTYEVGTGHLDENPNDIVFNPTTDITINAETGMIRGAEDIAGAKIDTDYIVRATVTETDEHVTAVAYYLIRIEAPDEAEPSLPGEIVIHLGDNFNYKGGSYYNTEEYWGEKLLPTTYSATADDFTYVKDDINMTFNIVNCMVTQYTNNWFLQVKSGVGAIKFTIPDGCESISYLVGEGQSGRVTAYFQINDGDKLESEEKSAKEVATYVLPAYTKGSTMTISSNYALRLANLTFNIKTKDENAAVEANLSFNDEDRVINMTAKVETPIPVILHADGLEFSDLTFDIDEISEMDEDETYRNYKINYEGRDYDNVSVIVNDPGVYTFRVAYDKDAETNTGKEFLSGMAILRLNVFPHLEVLPTNGDDLADDERTDLPELTLVHSTENEDGDMTATITLPTIDDIMTDKSTGLKYSTLTLQSVTIRHGADKYVYSVDAPAPSPAPEAIRTLDAETGYTDHISNMPETFDFTEDGSVTYKIVYASTEDFAIEEQIHVVIMPKTPELVEDNTTSGKFKNYVIVPDKNCALQYALISGYTEVPNRPDAPDIYDNAEQGVSTLAEDVTPTWATTNEAVQFSRPDDLADNLGYAVVARNIKDISSIVGDNGTLGSDYLYIALNSDNSTAGVEDVAIDGSDESNAVYYNLQGVRVGKDSLTPGVYVRVAGGTATKVHVRQ